MLQFFPKARLLLISNQLWPLNAQEEQTHAQAQEEGMQFCVGLIHEYFEYVDVLWSEKSCRHIIFPNYVRIDQDTRQSTQNDNQSPTCCWFYLQACIDNKRHDKVNLEVTRGVPAPVIASFIGDHIAWEKVDGHRKDGPPVLVTIREAFFVGEPARTRPKVGTNLPADQEN